MNFDQWWMEYLRKEYDGFGDLEEKAARAAWDACYAQFIPEEVQKLLGEEG